MAAPPPPPPPPADPSYAVALTAFGLGSLFSLSLLAALPLLPSIPKVAALAGNLLPTPPLAAYLAAWTFFHLMEYVVTAVWNPNKVDYASFLLTNGWAYHAAHLLVLVEYTLASYFFPSFKRVGWWTYVGLAIVLVGQVVRTLAMVHASASFSHHIAVMKKSDHVLVTTGIYAYMRHPSYMAYFWWAVGSQLLVGNPVMGVLFTLYLWRWFFTRIGDEERLLVKFFGDEYIQYRGDVVSGLPLVR